MDVLPVLSKAGCNSGSCHAKPNGQNGFKLSVFAYDPKSDYNQIVKGARGRRVFPAHPEESLIIKKPTLGIDHEGGQRFEIGSVPYQILVQWIKEGMTYRLPDEPDLERITIQPSEGRFRKGSAESVAVQAIYSDGKTREVTHLTDYTSSDKEIATTGEAGGISIKNRSGEAVVIARYMGMIDELKLMVPSDQHLESEAYDRFGRNNFIDELALSHFENLSLLPSEECSDSEFIRRAFLDGAGVLPSPAQAREFLQSTEPDKRNALISQVLDHPNYSDYWANKWADLLRPNTDRVGIKSVYMLDQWLRQSFRENKPYDQFVSEILLHEGSNHGEGPAVIYRDRRVPTELTTLFSQLFLGVRLECAKCHHHPFEKWSQTDFYQVAAFFGSVKQKGAGLSPPISAGTELFYFAPGGNVKHPVTEKVMLPIPPDASDLSLEKNLDPRRAFVAWMTQPQNEYFSKAIVNRIWAVFFGRGFVNPVDDFRTSNPPVNEPLLDELANDLIEHGFDLKHLMRTIMQSRLYQLSSIPNDTNASDTKNFSRFYRKRIPAEVLLDAIGDITNIRDEFQGMPPGSRAIETWNFKLESHFLDAFGRPNSSSDPPNERDETASVVQSLHLMNSTGLQSKLAHADGRVTELAQSDKTPVEIVNELYLLTYCRLPDSEESDIALQTFDAPNADRQIATEDILWALLNSAEFVFNH